VEDLQALNNPGDLEPCELQMLRVAHVGNVHELRLILDFAPRLRRLHVRPRRHDRPPNREGRGYARRNSASPDAPMTEDDEHDAAVRAWVATLGELPPDLLLTAFTRAFDAVRRRAQTTLGDVTLLAVGERVLYDAHDRFPAFSSVRLDAAGIDCADVVARGREALRVEEIRGFVGFMLAELLRVLGALTADVLTPALHRELLATRGPAPRTAGARDDEEKEGSA
jgi:hypothetical protein